MPRFTTQSRVEAVLGRSLTDEELVNFEEVVETISQFVKDYTGKNWADIDEVS